jgi:hypothetical protein
VSFAAITLCVAPQRVFIVVIFIVVAAAAAAAVVVVYFVLTQFGKFGYTLVCSVNTFLINSKYCKNKIFWTVIIDSPRK